MGKMRSARTFCCTQQLLRWQASGNQGKMQLCKPDTIARDEHSHCWIRHHRHSRALRYFSLRRLLNDGNGPFLSFWNNQTTSYWAKAHASPTNRAAVDKMEACCDPNVACVPTAHFQSCFKEAQPDRQSHVICTYCSLLFCSRSGVSRHVALFAQAVSSPPRLRCLGPTHSGLAACLCEVPTRGPGEKVRREKKTGEEGMRGAGMTGRRA